MSTKKILNDLKNSGVDTNGALDRFMGDTTLYKNCIDVFFEDKSFDELNSSIKEKKYDKALDSIFQIKDISCNLGFIPILKDAKVLSDDIKNKKYDKIQNELNALNSNVKSIKKIIN